MTRAIPRFTSMASASALALSLAAPLALAPDFITPAHAFFGGGFGRIVYDLEAILDFRWVAVG